MGVQFIITQTRKSFANFSCTLLWQVHGESTFIDENNATHNRTFFTLRIQSAQHTMTLSHSHQCHNAFDA